MAIIAHKRIRVSSAKVQEGPLSYSLSGNYSKSQGWTDIRILEIPPQAVLSAELVVAKGKTVPQILNDLARTRGGHWVAFNASYFNPTDGSLLGLTFKDNKAIFPDVAGKTELRPHLVRTSAGGFGIGRESSANGKTFGVIGGPTLVLDGKALGYIPAAEKMPSDILNTQPRTVVGLKADGTLGVILVDGRGPYDKGLTAIEAQYVAAHFGYWKAINLDGGYSSTLASNHRGLLDALDIDKSRKARNFHVSDMGANYSPRVTHHAVAIRLDVSKILPYYKVNHIPKETAANRRPGIDLNATSITIHNTGNPTSIPSGERNNLVRPDNHVTASFHIVLDAHEAIECIPLNEVAWHAGDGNKVGGGNRTSLSIEICESGDYNANEQKAVELVAKMLKERGWGVDRLRRHYDWSGKICPRMMYDPLDRDNKWKRWDSFKSRVNSLLNPAPPSSPNPPSNQVTIKVGEAVLPVKGTLEKGVTTAPVRPVVEALGASISFDDKTRTVNIKP